MEKVRQSNIELLRILSMLMLTIFHFNDHSLICGPIWHDGIANGFWWHMVQTLTITGTNIFVLITGYFGIHFKLRSVFRLYLMCFIWGLIGYLLYCFVMGVPVGFALLGRVFAFTHNKWWFIITYLELYFLSPVLNAAIEKMDERSHMYSIVVFSFPTIYLGYCHFMGEDTWGTSLSHFVYLYLIGQYIHKYISIQQIHQRKNKWLLGFLLTSILIFAEAMLKYVGLHLQWLEPYPYCNPLNILGALCLVLYTLCFDFQNKWINRLASSALAVYLLQGGPYFGLSVMYPKVADFLCNLSTPVCYGYIIGASVVLLLVTIVVDQLLSVLFYCPSLKIFDRMEAFIVRICKKLSPEI